MRIGLSCGTGCRQQCRCRTDGWASGEAGSTLGFSSYLISNKTARESRRCRLRAALLRENFSLGWPDADLIDAMRSHTACLDKLTCAAAHCSGEFLPGLGPTSLRDHQHPCRLSRSACRGAACDGRERCLQIVTALGELRRASAAATALAGQVGRDRQRLARVIRTLYFALSVLLFCVIFALSLVASR